MNNFLLIEWAMKIVDANCIFCNKECANDRDNSKKIIWRLCFKCKDGNVSHYVISELNQINITSKECEIFFNHIRELESGSTWDDIFVFIGDSFDGPFDGEGLRERYLYGL